MLLTYVADLHPDDEKEEEDEASAPTLVACSQTKSQLDWSTSASVYNRYITSYQYI